MAATCAHCGHPGTAEDPLLPYDPYEGLVMHGACAVAAESGEMPRLASLEPSRGLWQFLPMNYMDWRKG